MDKIELLLRMELIAVRGGCSLLDGSGGVSVLGSDVIEFHQGCGIPIRQAGDIATLDLQRTQLRWDLIDEEINNELRQALFVGDVPKLADAIIDSIYVLIGLAVEMGIPLGPIWKEVHAANMRKTTGPKREDGKQLKPEGWVGPDIEVVLRKYSNWKGDEEVVNLTTDATGKGV